MQAQDTPAHAERFWEKVDVRGPDECWPWLAAVNRYGYGKFQLRGHDRKAHRVAYELVVGFIPDGLTIDHLCRERACCNPSHMEPVTNRENVLRGVGRSAENARKDRCKRGHPFDAANTSIRPSGSRRCKACTRDDAARYRAARA